MKFDRVLGDTQIGRDLLIQQPRDLCRFSGTNGHRSQPQEKWPRISTESTAEIRWKCGFTWGEYGIQNELEGQRTTEAGVSKREKKCKRPRLNPRPRCGHNDPVTSLPSRTALLAVIPEGGSDE
jgi:hypothetical protein